jgi:acyl-coenzyme A synthetase/AMP-(fatty) acid ligase
MARLELAPTARTIPAALDDAIARRTGATALRGRWSAYTFAELGAVVRREAGALATLGVRRHTVVAASLPDHPDIVVLFLACMRLGAVWSGVDRRLDASDKARALRSARASV